MTGIGIILIYLGYAIYYWALNAIQGKSQDSFAHYILPFAPKQSAGFSPNVSGNVASTGGSPSATPPAPGAPAATKSATKPNQPSTKNGRLPQNRGF